MKVISFSEHLYDLSLFSEAGITQTVCLDAHKPYLFAEEQFKDLQKSAVGKFMPNISEAAPLIKELHAEADGKGKHVLLYNNVGGLGDNIMMWPLAKILHERGYKIHILTPLGYSPLWVGFPWVRTIMDLPISWDFVQDFFDAHVFFEFLTNWYVHKDQGHPLDIMLGKVGIDPKTIPASEKRVVPEFSPLEDQMTNRLYQGKQVAFVQLAASQHVRCLSPEHMKRILLAVAKAFPQIHWIALAGTNISPSYYEPPVKEPNLEFRTFAKLRILWALMRRAKVCLGPDSMLVHAAGTLGVPCVGLWGSHDPQTRVCYYPRHFPIFLKEKCYKAPCFWAAIEMPSFCPDNIPDRTRCGVLQAITEEMVIAKVQEAIDSQ